MPRRRLTTWNALAGWAGRPHHLVELGNRTLGQEYLDRFYLAGTTDWRQRCSRGDAELVLHLRSMRRANARQTSAEYDAIFDAYEAAARLHAAVGATEVTVLDGGSQAMWLVAVPWDPQGRDLAYYARELTARHLHIHTAFLAGYGARQARGTAPRA